MHGIEFLICLLLLAMTVPDICRRMGRPALTYPFFVVFGLLIGPLVTTTVAGMLEELAGMGFLFLLFEVGLEIQLPPVKKLGRELKFAGLWMAAQYPVCMLLASHAGFGWQEALLATAALTACAVGMAYPGWKAYPGEAAPKGFLLQVMVLLEISAILVMSLESAMLGKAPWWMPPLKLAGIVTSVLLVKRLAGPLDRLFRLVMERTVRWRVHLMAVIILLVCATGNRLGLSAPKTAFFLGLFLGHIEHDGKGLADHMAPISRGVLIPLFFLTLGVLTPVAAVFSLTGAFALGSAALLLLFRRAVHRRLPRPALGENAVWLFGPNLTMTALAAAVLKEAHAPEGPVVWLVLTGLFISIISIAMLPPSAPDAAADEPHAPPLPGEAPTEA